MVKDASGDFNAEGGGQEQHLVLIADDMELHSILLKRYLKNAGVPEQHIKRVTSGEESLSFWNENTSEVAAIFLNNKMPHISLRNIQGNTASNVVSINSKKQDVDIAEREETDIMVFDEIVYENTHGHVPLMYVYTTDSGSDISNAADRLGVNVVIQGDKTQTDAAIVEVLQKLGIQSPSLDPRDEPSHS